LENLAKKGRKPAPKNRKCPECGTPMVWNPKNFRFEYRNPNCPVIEIRVHRKSEEVLRSGCG